MAAITGFEPVIIRLTAECITNYAIWHFQKKTGALGRYRTDDTRIFSPLLLLSELQVHNTD